MSTFSTNQTKTANFQHFDLLHLFFVRSPQALISCRHYINRPIVFTLYPSPSRRDIEQINLLMGPLEFGDILSSTV